MLHKIQTTGLLLVFFSIFGCQEIIKELTDEHEKKEDPVTFMVKVENVSTPGTVDTERAGGTVPLSPGVYGVYAGHAGAKVFFAEGKPADEGTERIAEDGFIMAEDEQLSGSSAIKMNGTFDSPGGPDDGPALFAGEQATFMVKAKPGDYLQFETMFVQSNDWFYAFGDKGLSLFDGKTPISGDVTAYVVLYDAGTEEDTAPGTGPNQKPVQDPMATNVGPDDSVNQVKEADERHPDFMIPSAASVIKVTVTPQ